MIEPCLLCNCPEKNYKPPPNTDYVCGMCVQLLLEADKNDLRKAYTKAIEKGLERKALAIEIFLNDERINEQRKPDTKKHGRCFNRTRGIRPLRNRAKRIRQNPAKRKIAVL